MCAEPFAYLPCANDGTVAVVDIATHKKTKSIDVGSSPFGISVHPSGTRVYVANRGGNSLSIIDTAEGRVVTTVPVGVSPFGVAVHPNGSRVYVSNQQNSWDGESHDNGTVTVIDTQNNKPVRHIAIGAFPAGIALDAKGERLFVVSGCARWKGPGFSVIDTQSNKVVARACLKIKKADEEVDPLQAELAVSPVATVSHPKRERLYFSNRGTANVAVVDTETYRVEKLIPVGKLPAGLAIAPDGATLYVANKGKDTISVIDTAKNEVRATVEVASSPYGVAVTPSGDRVLVANVNSGTISVISAESLRVTHSIDVGPSPYALGMFVAK